MFKRGRKALIDPEDVFKVLEKYKLDIYNKGVQKGSSDPIWGILSAELENKIPSKTLYISVYQNRHNYQSRLLNLPIQKKKDHIHYGEETDDEPEISLKNEYFNILGSKKICFKLTISYQEYLKFEPQTINYKDKNRVRTYNVLKQNVWSDIINDAFLKEYKLPCNFVYKHCKVNVDISRSKYFLSFDATCKDCCNSLHGWSEKKPQKGCSLELKIMTCDTRGYELQHTTKRHLKGMKRKLVASQMTTDIASNWRLNQASELEFNCTSPPNLYKHGVLRKAKQEYKDDKLGIKVNCPIKSLVELKHSQFSTSIHSIGIDPLVVHYWSNFQLVIYKNATKSYCKLSIDATGGLVKKLKRTSMHLLSAHIFLYEAVVSTPYGQLSVTQMISEKQDTLTIYTRLERWLLSGVKTPNEVVCDNSAALLGAITRTFCEMNMRTYSNQCFDILIGKSSKLPNCYIRIDVAHMMKIFCRISYFKSKQNSAIKHFYVRCLRILLTSDSLDDFTDTLKAVLTVAMSATDGWVNNTIHTPAESSRIKLLSKIKGIKIEEFNYDCDINGDFIDITENEEEEREGGESVINYLKEIEHCAITQSKIKGNRISAHYLPDLTPIILRLCKNFTLWSGVMKNIFRSPYSIASSASVESDFGNLKKRILRFETQPMTADRFVATHLKALDSNCKLFRSMQIRNEAEKDTDRKKNEFSDNEVPRSTNAPNTLELAKTVKIKSLSNNETVLDNSDSDSSFSLNTFNKVENWRGLTKSEESESTEDEKKKTDKTEQDTNGSESSGFLDKLDEAEYWRRMPETKELSSPENNMNATYTSDSDNSYSVNTFKEDDEEDESPGDKKKIEDNTTATSSDNGSSYSLNSFYEVENWRGQGKSNNSFKKTNKKRIDKKRFTVYMDSIPEIDRILKKKNTRSTLNTLLINGNKSTPLNISKNKCLIYNTCPFDAVAVIIAMAYTDITGYQEFIDSNNNEMLLFCKNLALYGSKKSSYIKRLEILRPHFNEINNITNIKIIDVKCNVQYIIIKLLESAPSAIEIIRCTNPLCSKLKKQRASPTVILNFMSSGFKEMHNALTDYVSTKIYDCNICGNSVHSDRKLQNHLFIETDSHAGDTIFSIEDFPVQLRINNDEYKLYGVVAYHPGHYVAHIRRAEATWETHNDLEAKIKRCSSKTLKSINPHTLVYIKN